jgi:uncharacterized protein DUF6812
VDQRKEDVVLETDRYRIAGKMTLPSEGMGSRLSDHVNRHDLEFFTVQDATLSPLDGGDPHTEPVVMVASRHIRLISPREPG